MVTGSTSDHSDADIAGSGNPLHDPDILQHVLGYVGPGHWYFLATVNSLWAALCAQVTAVQMQCAGFSTRVITCAQQMTLFSTVLASPSRVKAAYPCLSSSTRFRRAAGRHADMPTLMAARELGFEYSPLVMTGAAECNSLAVIQFLHAEGCPWVNSASGAMARRRCAGCERTAAPGTARPSSWTQCAVAMWR
jgi:hypothetical protein